MLEQELKNIWKNSAKIEKVKFDTSRLLIEINDRMTQLERGIRRRDRREIGTALVSIPVFAYIAYVIPFPLTKVGAILAILNFVYFIYRLRTNKKRKRPTQLDASFANQLENQKANLKEESRLLNTVEYWFLIPAFIPYCLSIIGLGNPADYDWNSDVARMFFPLPLSAKITSIVIAVVMFTLIIWVNKRVVKKTLKPMIADIENIQEQLEKVF